MTLPLSTQASELGQVRAAAPGGDCDPLPASLSRSSPWPPLAQRGQRSLLLWKLPSPPLPLARLAALLSVTAAGHTPKTVLGVSVIWFKGRFTHGLL